MMNILVRNAAFIALLAICCSMAQAVDVEGPRIAAPINHVQKVVTGELFACALKQVSGTRGSVSCWGFDDEGTLGRGYIDTFGYVSTYAVRVSGLDDIIDITAGVGHVCALERAGSVKCWGHNELGQLGNGDDALSSRSSPTLVFNDISSVTSIEAGAYHTCAIAGVSAEVYCWGLNVEGQLGQPTSSTIVNVPVNVLSAGSALYGAEEIAAGGYHTCARFADGSVQCWGDNTHGQLGNGTFVGGSSPVRANAFGESPSFMATQLAAGTAHTCALTTGNGELCWGDNTEGELGIGIIGGAKPSPTAISVLPLDDVKKIAAGYYASCAILYDHAVVSGKTYCWGTNDFGQLGNGTKTKSPIPVVVTFAGRLPRSVTSVALSDGGTTSSKYGCAVVYPGNVQCWGSNSGGELGDGTLDSTTVPMNFVVEDDLIFRDGFNH
jgi:alpha-tubulin suppressor-like RCC1 family protein